MRWLVAATGIAALFGTAAYAGGAPAFAGKWRIAAVSGAHGLDPAKATFEAAADGRVSTTVGCNRMNGKPAVDGDWMTFGPMASTRMACPPPLDRLEANYAAALATVRSWRVEGKTLLLLDAGGAAAVTLERAE